MAVVIIFVHIYIRIFVLGGDGGLWGTARSSSDLGSLFYRVAVSGNITYYNIRIRAQKIPVTFLLDHPLKKTRVGGGGVKMKVGLTFSHNLGFK